MKDLIGAYDNTSGSSCPTRPGPKGMFVCLNPIYGYSWAVQGLNDTKDGVPLSLSVDPWYREPNTPEGEAPIQLTGTLHISGLNPGQKYAVYRWDSVEAAFDYTRPAVHRFTASAAKLNYTDTSTFISNGSTYYRCIEDNA